MCLTALQLTKKQDTTPPLLVLNEPSLLVAQCGALPSVPLVTATDACDATPRVTLNVTRVNNACMGNYSLERTWTATDDCGNKANTTQRVIVQV